ncbi:MAG: TylF/MycF/NovP-related O-methyltransferase [Vicinamibacterales bacterium]
MTLPSSHPAEWLEDAVAEGAPDFLRELQAFPKFAPRQSVTRFLGRYELFKQVLDVPGSIVECGVYSGGGVFSWAHFSAILEPVHYARRVIGFDTFAGFPGLADGKDRSDGTTVTQAGGFAYRELAQLQRAAARFDRNRFLGEIPKIEFVEGDAIETMPRYVAEHPHLVVALLYLDFDLYDPTLAAIRTFLPRMPRGSVIAFDELNKDKWPGETLAALEGIGFDRLRLRRFPFDSLMSYAVIGD